MEHVLRRMRWRAHYFLQLGESNDKNKESGEDDENDIDDEDIENRKFSSIFRSPAKPPFIKEMVSFEKEFLDLAKNLEFRQYNNGFQKK